MLYIRDPMESGPSKPSRFASRLRLYYKNMAPFVFNSGSAIPHASKVTCLRKYQFRISSIGPKFQKNIGVSLSNNRR
jgi:hypothetical protein